MKEFKSNWFKPNQLQEQLDALRDKKLPFKTILGTYNKIVERPYSQHFDEVNNRQFKRIPEGQ